MYQIITCEITMVSVSKFVISFFMLLTILVAFQFNDGESSIFEKEKVTVYVVNNITNMKLGVRCKDKNNDAGYQVLDFNQSYAFTFRPMAIIEKSLWFCRFTWPNEFYYFDIYKEARDEDTCNTECHWEINKSGPCRVNGYNLDCYPWNKKVVVQKGQDEINNPLIV